jgi:hypothetical protein
MPSRILVDFFVIHTALLQGHCCESADLKKRITNLFLNFDK